MIEDIRDITSFRWGRVITVSPLSIQLDGDTAPLGFVPDSLVEPSSLQVGDRLRVEWSMRKVVIHGRVGGDFPLLASEVREMYSGTIPATWTGGMPDVLLDTGATIVPYAIDRGITLKAGDNVVVRRDPAGNYFVMDVYATVAQGGYAHLSGGSTPYGVWDPRAWGAFEPPREQGKSLDPQQAIVAHRGKSGVVTLSGIGISKTLAANAVVAVLPMGFRPSVYHRFRCTFNGSPWHVEVRPDGQIITLSAAAAGQFFSLSNIKFHAAQMDLTWTPIPAFSSSFIANSSGTFGAPAYAMDAYGDVWLRGMVSRATALAGTNLPLFTLPAGYRVTREHHFNAYASQAAYQFLGAQAATGVIWAKSAHTAGGIISLSGVVFSPTANDGLFYLWNQTQQPFANSLGYNNSWVDYDAANFTPGGFRRRDDGLVLIRGLVRSGAIGAGIAWVYQGMLSISRNTWEVPSNSAAGRLDVGGLSLHQGSLNNFGALDPVLGSNAWMSLDGIAWQGYW